MTSRPGLKAVEPATETHRRVAERMWREVTQRLPLRGLDRVKALLDVVGGRLEPQLKPFQGQQQRWFMPGLDTSPWLAREDFTEVANALEGNFDELRKEILGDWASTAFRPYGVAMEEPAAVKPGNPLGWDEVKLWEGLAPTSNVLNFPAAARVMRLVLDRSELLNQFSFFSLKPRTRLPPHADRANWLVSVHIGIVVPERAGIRVAAESRNWSEGRCIFFDNSFEHEAWNDGDVPRVVLALHLAHPRLTPIERAALRIIHNHGLALAAVGPEATDAWARVLPLNNTGDAHIAAAGAPS